MRDQRRHFHQQLEDLEQQIQDMGMAAEDLVERAVRAVSEDEARLCDEVSAGDDVVDGYYFAIERHILSVFALQTPVATDLRLLTAALHIHLHLERVADMAVNIAKMVKVSQDPPRNALVVQQVEEMGGQALKMLAAARDAFARRDVRLCRHLTVMDASIDHLNRGMLARILETSDVAMLRWGIGMHFIARDIERIGDHAVDIGEQISYIVTGRFVEFTDASHPGRWSTPRCWPGRRHPAPSPDLPTAPCRRPEPVHRNSPGGTQGAPGCPPVS
jgi:phosphate transport system protein